MVDEAAPGAKAGRRFGIFVVLLLSAAAPWRATASEPLCDWLQGLGAAAQALHDGRTETSALEARGALSARSSGEAGARARQALDLASEAQRLVPVTGSAPPEEPPVLSGDERLQRAEELQQRGLSAEALAQADRADRSIPPPPAGRLALLRAMALVALGRMEEAEEVARPLAEARGEPGVRRGATWVLARAASRAGRQAEASARYAEVAASTAPVPGLEPRRSLDLGDEAAYLSAWAWYDAGEYRKASARLDAFAASHPRSRRVEDARWFSAWGSWRRGDKGAAQAALARLESSGLADAAFYWQGRLASGKARAQDRYTRAALLGGDGWYGWLARARLRALGAPEPPWGMSEARVEEPPDEATRGRLLLALEALQRGERERSALDLEVAVRVASDRGAAAVAVCELAAFAGDHDLAYRTARDSLGVTRQSLRWLFPEAFGDRLRRPADALGLDPDLLLALVRRESAFRPESRSRAGAVGLGQLLPATAVRLETLAGADPGTGPRLDQPEANLAFAAHYLALLQDRFGDEAVALAAYNAGPRVVAGWSVSRTTLPLDEWVESVPYRETRLYLKQVLPARERYRQLHGAPPGLDPARAIAVGQDGLAF